jgi:allantoate deiminase
MNDATKRKVSRPRLTERLEELGAIGAGAGGGANRPGLGRAEQQACELVARWMAAAGLEVAWDSAGNLYGRSPGEQPELPEVWTGSHLDTVPGGGRFDGALGVVGGLEAVERLHATPRTRTLAVVAFRDEEGSRFGSGTFGSLALCGRLAPEALAARDAQGTTVREALAALGLCEPPPGGWLETPPPAFVEAHVEQGPVLERLGAPLGVVTAIAAMARFTREFAGVAGHAGTTPMTAREDALCRAAEYVLAVRAAARRIDGAVATVGTLTVEPGAVNVIPARATLTVDARAPDRARLDEVVQALGEPPGLGSDDVSMAAAPSDALRAEIARLGLPAVDLVSGAGHDAAVLAAAGVPTAMLFVRSLAGGISHSPQELTSAEDAALCVDVLTGALDALSSR